MAEIHIVFWHWFILSAVLGAVEILAPGVFFLWLALAAFVTGATTFFIPDMQAASQILIFGALAIVLVYAAWKYIRKNPTESDQPLLNQRAAQYIGKVYKLESAIENGVGRVKLGDGSWRVEGPDLAAGSKVRVVAVDGATLKVEEA